MRVCTETIYRFIYGKEDYALSSISICRRAAANAALAVRGNPATVPFLLPAGYRNGLTSLVIVRNSATGKATC
ncbi:hypothetical protein RLEG12_00265 (plasmid) [Rhizobium leguminosarum bv. trifolii CB782]|nr:hypothetical protein RLEG12_00265 [Rhizobium leguminosarum bv. trifolii CB782]